MGHAQIFIFVLSLSFQSHLALQRPLLYSVWFFCLIFCKLRYFSFESAWVMPKFSFLSCASPFKAIWLYSDLYSTLVCRLALFLVNYGSFSLRSVWQQCT